MQSIVFGRDVLRTSVGKNRLTVFLRFFLIIDFLCLYINYENDTEVLDDKFQFSC